MRNKILASIVAGGLLVGAGFVTSVVSSPTAASAQEDAGDSEDKGFLHRGFEFLSGVLSDLVSEGTIEQSDADAVLAAVEEKAAEIKAEREATRELTQELLEDDVITEDEATQLSDDHPFFNEKFDEAWEDGELTTEEIREIRPHHRRGGFRRGAHFGALLDDGGIDQAEYNDLIESLGEDHPLAQIDVSQYFDGDDLITVDELREIRENWKDSNTEDPAA
ncbi:MAG: hypothetical protein O6951_02730 [Actinobacteria bacterium]|nr:hypothetical protein [Actinomycetota bacterium]